MFYMNDAIIVDLDGTISSSAWREHLIGDPPDWHRFHTHLTQDDPIPEIIDLVHEWYARPEVDVLLVTARTETYRYITEWWLMEHGIRYHHLFMRPESDRRKSPAMKRAIYDDLIAGRWNVVHAFEDHPGVCEVWRSLGIAVTECTDPGGRRDFTSDMKDDGSLWE